MSSENESVSPPLNVEKCSLVLVDVAGTTTSIDFVKNTLFPFVIDRVEGFLSAKWEDDAVKEGVKKLQEGDQELDVAKAVEVVKKLTEENSANEGLKSLQGLIYKEGYEKGDLKAHVFEDVADAFETWAKIRKVAIYSTGSVDSQKLLFAHTVSGDLTPHISNFFDQTVGKKTEAESYKKIAEETQVPPEEIVFVTDDPSEATAAKAGGLHAVLIKRDGNPELLEEALTDFLVVSSFDELMLDKTSKRKIEEGPVNVEAPPSKHAKTDSKTTGDNVAEKVEQESMEVDPQPEKPAETEKTETATEETENLVKNAPEKTETEDKTEDTEMKEIEKEKTESETPVETVVEVTVEELEPTGEELPAVIEDVQPIVEEADAMKEETKTEEAEKVVEEPKPVEQIIVEEVEATVEEPAEVVANIEAIVEEPPTEETEKTEKKAEQVPSTEEPKEEIEEAVMAEPEPEETQPDVEMAEAKPEETKTTDEKPLVEEAEMKNGEEEGETSAPKVEEKENKSVLANGVENGNKDESEVDNATEAKESETAEVTNDDNVDNKDDDNEVKVKKLEESAESKTVSVEV